MSFLDRLQGLGRKLKESKLPELAGVVLGETPIGKIGRIIKGAADILGTDEDPDAIAAALEGATPEQRTALLELAVRETEATEETEREIQRQATARHAADMLSDSWFSKHIRPLSLAVTLGAYLVLVFLAAFLLPLDRSELILALISGLSSLLIAQIGFYFGGRSGEKITSLIRRK